MKSCSKCSIAKPLDEFSREDRLPDGHKAACKACVAGARADRPTGRPAPLAEIDGPRPLCFTPLQWQDWTRGERNDALEPGYAPEPNGYCTHCTLARKTMMKAADKCGHPEVDFVEVEAGEVIGVRNKVIPLKQL